MPAQNLETQLAMVQALFARPNRGSDGRQAFAQAYPQAPDAMIQTAAFHVYVDGCAAAVAFLAEAERFLRDQSEEIGYAETFELLYHIYNWHQFRALLPEGKAEMLTLLAELKQHVADADLGAIAQTVQELEDTLEGSRTPPDFE